LQMIAPGYPLPPYENTMVSPFVQRRGDDA
jgi:hypothetical protein